jgi:hypothetical protein
MNRNLPARNLSVAINGTTITDSGIEVALVIAGSLVQDGKLAFVKHYAQTITIPDADIHDLDPDATGLEIGMRMVGMRNDPRQQGKL